MIVEKHTLYGILLGIFLYCICEIKLILIITIVLASILIDVDHFFYYIFKFKQYNPLKMSTYFRRYSELRNSTTMLPIFIFHNIETVILLYLISLAFPIFIYILFGVIFHMILDWMVMPIKRYPGVIKISLIWVLIENNRRKRGCPKW